MKVLSWNVNGLRASIRNSAKNLKGFLDSLDAEVICFQETKATRDQLDEPTYSADGYNGYFSFCRTRSGYSGVVTFCRDAATPLTAEEGLTGVLSKERGDSVKCYGCSDHYTEKELISLDAEGRSVLTEHELRDGGRLVVVNVYCPMVERGSDNQDRMDYKLRFYSALKERCSALEKAGKSVLVLGDLNFTREVKDSSYLQEDPKLFQDSHPPRDFMEHFIVSTPTDQPSKHYTLLDTFRHLNPTADKSFTCWSTMFDCRKTNYGTRIDYILCSMALSHSLVKAEVWHDFHGSDHCPVFAEFTFSLTPSSVQPSLSATYFSFGKQKKISDFFTSKFNSAHTSSDCHPPPTKKRKASKPSGTKTLLSFMQPLPQQFQASSKRTKEECKQDSTRSNTELISQTERETTDSKEVCTQIQVAKTEADCSMLASKEPQVSLQKSTSGLTEAWQSIFTGPPKAPLCQGHQELCVLRTVKKQGPNLNRQFWVCARPYGSKSDPTSRCEYFKWVKKK